jgi:hypothetical protein
MTEPCRPWPDTGTLPETLEGRHLLIGELAQSLQHALTRIAEVTIHPRPTFIKRTTESVMERVQPDRSER